MKARSKSARPTLVPSVPVSAASGFQGLYRAQVSSQWCVEIAARWCQPGEVVYLGHWPEEAGRVRLYSAVNRDTALHELSALDVYDRTPHLADLQCLAECEPATIRFSGLLKIPQALRKVLGAKPPFELHLCGQGAFIELIEASAHEAHMETKISVTANQELPKQVQDWFAQVLPLDDKGPA